MDAQHYVDVAIIADFKMVKLLTSDTELILSCVANSDKVGGGCSETGWTVLWVWGVDVVRCMLVLRSFPVCCVCAVCGCMYVCIVACLSCAMATSGCLCACVMQRLEELLCSSAALKSVGGVRC